MERQQELKVLLKRWEAEFLRQRGRKPSQADIEEAPPETRRLYQEYGRLKKMGKTSEFSGKNSEFSGKTSEFSGHSGSQEIPKVEQVEDSGFWGSHLNRAPKIPGKNQSGNPRPGISAEFYGMKLKTKLGTIGKEPPLTPRRIPNPKKIPKKSPKSPKISEHGAEISPTEPSRKEEKTENPEKSENSPKFQPFHPSIPLGMDPKFSPFPPKFQFLKEKLAETLESLDPSWIERCEKSPKKSEIPPKFGNFGKKRKRENEGNEENPEKIKKSFQEKNSEILGMKKKREEKEKEKFRSGSGEKKMLEKEEKTKGEAKNRAPPGNFVRLNMKRKIYSRAFQRGRFLRKQVWRQKWRKKFGAGGDGCFRCGGKGHWASECTEKNLGSFPEKIPEQEEPIPTLDQGKEIFIPDFPDDLDLENSQFPPPPPPVDPFYSPNPDGTIPDPPEEILEALRILGFDSFRPGQAEPIMRILSGLSTVVLLPTGTGKSLCYQLPAFLHHRRSGSICLVISPLISLMDDQVSNLPPPLKAVAIHSNLTPRQRRAAIKKVIDGQVQILFLSPESLVSSWNFWRFFPHFPPVAFACLDEIHCVSHSSHNFRPCYLRVCKVLRRRLGLRCFLGLSATLSALAAIDLERLLAIPARSAAPPPIPPNLELSVSAEPQRERALLELLRVWNLGNSENFGGKFGNFGSMIVYCSRREESERLARLIRQQFPNFGRKNGKKNGKGKFGLVAAYHAGLDPEERREILEDFVGDEIAILCSTSALGMGLNKGNVRGIVHYSAPRGLEEFVQEIGRAGRDGGKARCHLFWQPQDLLELRRHIHENSVDFLAVKILIQKIFAPCKCLENHPKIQENSKEIPKLSQNSRICRGHQRSIPIQEFVETLDLREEGIETLLTLLELQPQKFLEIFPSVPSRCRIRFPKNSPEWQREAALRCPPLRFLLAQNPSGILGISGISGISGSLEFDAVALGDSMGWEFQRVRESLEKIPWEMKKAGKSCRIQVEFGEFSFYFRAFGDLNCQELDSCWEFLNSQILSREKFELRRLQRCFKTFESVASPRCLPEPSEQEMKEKNSKIRELLREYFEEKSTELQEEEEEKNPGMDPAQEEEIRGHIRDFLAAYPDEEFSGRAVARIFHGIGSPRFPAQIFGRDRRFWRRLLPVEFRSLSRLASQEILALR